MRREEFPKLSRSLEMAPVTQVRDTHSDVWVPYVPNPKVVVVIAPGPAMKQHAYLYKDLERQGYDVVGIFDERYDHYPPGTDVLSTVGISGLRMPDWKLNRSKN